MKQNAFLLLHSGTIKGVPFVPKLDVMLICLILGPAFNIPNNPLVQIQILVRINCIMVNANPKAADKLVLCS